MKNVTSLFSGEQRQEFFDDSFIDFVEQVNAIVRRQLGNQFGRIIAANRFSDRDLIRQIEEVEDLCTRLRVRVLKDGPCLFGS